MMFDPNGGDLGLSEVVINPEQFLNLIPIIHKIMLDVKKEFNPDKPLKYCFRFGHQSNSLIYDLIHRAEEIYGVEFYSCDGKKVFEIRGISGGIVTGYVCYLIVR